MTSWKEWVRNTSNYKEIQSLVEKSLSRLIEGYFKNSNEYVQEKFAKSFSETILYLENSLQKSRGIHPSRGVHPSQCRTIQNMQREIEDQIKKHEEIKKILTTEVKRQCRHYNIFLSDLNCKRSVETGNTNTDDLEILINDKHGIGYATIHHNGTCYVATMYQDRLDLFDLTLNENTMLEQLYDGKAYIAEGDSIESVLEKVADFWFLDKTILINLYKNHTKEFSNVKTAAYYTKSYMLPALIYKIKKQEDAV